MKRFIKLGITLSVVALTGLFVSSAATDLNAGTLVGKVERSKGGKSQNTIVYLKGVQGKYEPPQEPAVLDQKDKVFIPHLLAVQRGQALRFKNSDSFAHNVQVYWGNQSMLNQSQPPNGYTDWTPGRTGEYVLLCKIHPEMMAFVLVFDHPFFAQVNSSEFQIKNIPAGTYTLVAVREVRGKMTEKDIEVSIKGEETTQVTIQD